MIGMDKKYIGLEENLDRFKNDLTDEKTRLLFSIAYKQGYDKALSIAHVVESGEELPCGDLIKHNFSINKIGRCIPCERIKEK